MKRRLALSLAALLLLGCLTPALAAEGDAELSLYQQYGPWGEWPQEQKDAAEETWTDGQWDDYWTEYDAQMWAALNRYNEDYDRWSYARFGDPWDEYLRVEKEEMGMPYPDGINVSLNGAYLDFGGTAPLAASGCTMVPFRAFLEGLGAEVAFDGSRIAAALENGDSLELVLGATGAGGSPPWTWGRPPLYGMGTPTSPSGPRRRHWGWTYTGTIPMRRPI